MENEKLIIKSKHTRGEDGYKVFSIRVKEETVFKIDEIAQQTGHSRNELIGKFLDFALERIVIKN